MTAVWADPGLVAAVGTGTQLLGVAPNLFGQHVFPILYTATGVQQLVVCCDYLLQLLLVFPQVKLCAFHGIRVVERRGLPFGQRFT